ncbi:tryptophan-rich sensory protein [Micromonospora sp. Llam7]|uniref:tryptophan-rich sensory protein n=1 Tax=Micromonospora tarapacensis TaxID=2835305 RepID=UPI001C83DA30|nr:tryptophan-rich sensory protein [Micromonospora tarapacensis]MBX7265501.1 tryptophan-rich sensory protein [Micromonospora tarapacensis]
MRTTTAATGRRDGARQWRVGAVFAAAVLAADEYASLDRPAWSPPSWLLGPVCASRAAAALLLPYWAWVTFAASLDYSVWRLNG